MKKLFTFFKTLNNVFITIVLAIFYFLVIGPISFFYRVFKHKNNNQTSYWKIEGNKILDQGYFSSPY